jgi:hypothetical protein
MTAQRCRWAVPGIVEVFRETTLPKGHYRRSGHLKLDGVYLASHRLCAWHDGWYSPGSGCWLLGDRMTSTVQEPFFRLLPQHVLVRPPSLSEAHISEAGQVEKISPRPRHMTVPGLVADVGKRSSSRA